jgi:deoxyadenosine/deoxycytidine kinase
MTRRQIVGPKRFVAIAGNIGAGKSSLVDFLSHEYGIAPFFEPNETNPYLSDFYRDMKAWSFHSQIYFLSQKFRIHQELTATSDPVLQDRTIYEDAEIFAENLYRQKKMSKRDYETYRSLYEVIVAQLRPPTLMIYLRCSIPALKKRIKLRGRADEQKLPRGYLERLDQLYEEWFAKYRLSETLIIDTDRMDYLTDLVDRIDLYQRIERALS